MMKLCGDMWNVEAYEYFLCCYFLGLNKNIWWCLWADFNSNDTKQRTPGLWKSLSDNWSHLTFQSLKSRELTRKLIKVNLVMRIERAVHRWSNVTSSCIAEWCSAFLISNSCLRTHHILNVAFTFILSISLYGQHRSSLVISFSIICIIALYKQVEYCDYHPYVK